MTVYILCTFNVNHVNVIAIQLVSSAFKGLSMPFFFSSLVAKRATLDFFFT